MAKITVNIPDNIIQLGKDLMSDDSLRDRFDENPVEVLNEYGFKLPEELTSDKLKEFKVKDMIRDMKSMDRTAMRAAAVAEAEIVVEAAMTPYTYPVTMVVVGVAVATTVGE